MALHEALAYKDWDRANMIISDRLSREPHHELDEVFMGRLPIHVAIANGAPTHLVERILVAHPEGAATPDDANRRLPLHEAAANSNSLSIFELLLASNPAAARCTDAQGRMPLHLAVSGNQQSLCSIDALELLLAEAPQALTTADTAGCLPLHLAAGDSTAETVKWLLKKASEAVFVADFKGKLPLHWAAFKDSPPEVLQHVLNANPRATSAVDVRKQIPLHLVSRARSKGALPKAAALLEACPASVHWVQKDHKSAIALARGAGSRNRAMTVQLERWAVAMFGDRPRVDAVTGAVKAGAAGGAVTPLESVRQRLLWGATQSRRLGQASPAHILSADLAELVAQWLADTLRGPLGVALAEQLAEQPEGWVGRPAAAAGMVPAAAAADAGTGVAGGFGGFATLARSGSAAAGSTGGASDTAGPALARLSLSEARAARIAAARELGGASLIRFEGDGDGPLDPSRPDRSGAGQVFSAGGGGGRMVSGGSGDVRSGMEEENSGIGGLGSCSCVDGNPCISPYNCLDWAHRHEVALRARMPRPKPRFS